MATMTVKNIPDDLYEDLKRVAKLHRRSLNSEIIVCLERVLRGQRPTVEKSLKRARAIRESMPGEPLAFSEIADAKESGRP